MGKCEHYALAINNESWRTSVMHLVSEDQLVKKADTLSVVCGTEEGPSQSVPSFSGSVTNATAFICFPAEMG